jgi:hypothetical protein
MESALAIVVKLISAEKVANIDEAKKYIDVESLYGGLTDTISAESIWEKKVLFFYKLGKNKKFTNNFPYHDYIIKEEYKEAEAKITFEATNDEDPVIKIIYSLEIDKQKWRVVKIDYVKK